MIIVYIILAVVIGFGGVKYLHNETTKKPIEHKLECPEKDIKSPHCKCETLEAEKVVIKP